MGRHLNLFNDVKKKEGSGMWIKLQDWIGNKGTEGGIVINDPRTPREGATPS